MIKQISLYPNISDINIEQDLMDKLKNLYYDDKQFAYSIVNRDYGINAHYLSQLIEDKLVIFSYKFDENKQIHYDTVESIKKEINGNYTIQFPKNKLLESKDLENCWVSPSGYIEICEFEHHISMSYKILKRYLRLNNFLNSETELENLGWFRISDGSIMLTYSNDYNFKFTQDQINLIFDILQQIPIRFLGEDYHQNNFNEFLSIAEKYGYIG